MDNKHRKIKGYRELTQQEIDLMNKIKSKGAELLALQNELVERLVSLRQELVLTVGSDNADDFERYESAEPLRWAAIGKTDIQTGVMALVRAVAMPVGV